MRLRQRLALTTIVACVPWVIGSAWLHQLSRERFELEMLPNVAVAHMLAAGRLACEANPAGWVGAPFLPPGATPPRGLHPPGPWEIRLYSHAAPRLEALSAVADGNGRVSVPGCALALDVAMPWTEGPCAKIVVCRPPSPRGNPWVPSWRLFVPTGIAIAALMLALGPVVRRLRRLTDQVAKSAEHGYDAPIEMSGHDEVTELAHAFDEASRALRAAVVAREKRERALRDFLEDTTHDVMIPLTVLQGHLTSLKDSPSGAALDGACNEAHYIASLLHNLAAVAKLDAAEPQALRQPVALDEVVTRVVARHLPIAKNRRIALDFAVPPGSVTVDGDVTLIEQAVSNVVYNAVRYNHDGGNVAVTLDRGADGAVRIVVFDDGPGIDEASMARLHERYVRGDTARTRAPHGQGLGLNIVRRVCDTHGWELRLSRSEYGGLQVELIVPPPA